MFWDVLGLVFEESVPTEYETRIRFLECHNIALWDVFSAAERVGSLDSNIADEEFNDIVGLLEEYPTINTIVLNGGKASKAFKKYAKLHKRELMPTKIGPNPAVERFRQNRVRKNGVLNILAGPTGQIWTLGP